MSTDGKAMTEQQGMELGPQRLAEGWKQYWVKETKDCWIVVKQGTYFVKLPKRLTGNSKVAALEVARAMNYKSVEEALREKLSCAVSDANHLEKELDEARREAYSLKKEIENLRDMRKRDNIALAQLVQNAQETL